MTTTFIDTTSTLFTGIANDLHLLVVIGIILVVLSSIDFLRRFIQFGKR